MDTRGNNGLVVGAKGSNVKRIEEETGAKVDCMKAAEMVLEMPWTFPEALSPNEGECKCRSIRLVTGCRPPPGGTVAPARVVSTSAIHSSSSMRAF